MPHSTATLAPPKPGSKASAATPKTATQKALEKLGLKRDIDLALHLPLRYEDETRITQLRDVREGDTVQIEGRVTDCEVSFRPRRQLVVTLDDGTDTCTLRFFSFYPSQQKALAVGNRIRARGEVKGGFLGYTMLHPAIRSAGGALATALTPIYPTVAGLSQPVLRKEVLAGLARAELSDTFPPGDLSQINPQPLWTLRKALSFLHHPTPDVSLDTLQDHSHPAWQRLKAEELLAILQDDPCQRPPPFEKLVGDLAGAYSRRINIQHRIVYEIFPEQHTVRVLRMWPHYE